MPGRSTASLPAERIERAILLVRGHRVMLDSDLAALYGVPTKRLNEQVRRNRARFPADFLFQLTAREATALRSQFATSKRGGRRYRPHVFSEHYLPGASTTLSLSGHASSVGLVPDRRPVAPAASPPRAELSIRWRDFRGTVAMTGRFSN
jgi:hypothetical protein